MEIFSVLLALSAGNSQVTDTELCCFLRSAPEPTVEKTLERAGDLRDHRTHYDVTEMSTEDDMRPGLLR